MQFSILSIFEDTLTYGESDEDSLDDDSCSMIALLQ